MVVLNKEQWASDFLAALGNTSPSKECISFVWGWQQEESGAEDNSPALYNPLNTTWQMTGSTNFNSAKVQNYATYSDGITASRLTLENGDYPTLLKALQQNDDTLLTSDDVAGDLSVWVWGNRSPIDTSYVGSIVQLMQQHGGNNMSLVTNSKGMVLDIAQSYQLENGETQDACGPWSVSSLRLAGLPNKGPRGSAEDIDVWADAEMNKYMPNGQVNWPGSSIQQMYQFLSDSLDPTGKQRNLHWWDLATVDVSHITAAVKAGYPVLVTVNEQNLREKKTGKQPPYPWNLNTNHIIPIVGIDPDGDFICADELNNNFQGYWPVIYVASVMKPSWATVVQVVGPDPTHPWLAPIPSNDPTNWQSGFTAQLFADMSPPVQPPSTDWQLKAFSTEWTSEIPGLSVTTGIAQAALKDYRAGNSHGPARSQEYQLNDWNGKFLTAQNVAMGVYFWDGSSATYHSYH